MRKILIFLAILLPIVCNAKKKKVTYKLCIASPVVCDTPRYENDSVCFDFDWLNCFLKVTIDNKTNKRMSVEWENVRINDGLICFDDDNAFTYQAPKESEVIHTGSHSRRMIMKRSNFDYYAPLFSKFMLEKFHEASVRLIIPIRYETETVDYNIRLVLKEEEIQK